LETVAIFSTGAEVIEPGKPLAPGKIYDIHKTFAIAYYGASILLILAAVMVFFVKPPHHTVEAEAA
jgi:molybdopterin biosynthesis enzyme